MSPINKRLPRELRHNFGKYAGLFLLIALCIAMVSGYLVGARSVLRIISETNESAKIEDFSFTTQFEASADAIAAVERVRGGCNVYETFYSDVDISGDGIDTDDDATVRVYTNRADVDLASFWDGEEPTSADEIALDKTFAANHDIEVGDTVKVAGHKLRVSGIMVLPDYQALVKKNTDMLFDAQTFCVATLTPEGFDKVAGSITYHYSAVLHDEGMDLIERTSYEEDVVDALGDANESVVSLIDWSDNYAANFANDDIEGDQRGYIIMCLVLLVVSAFVFVVLTGATIEQEASVIGTLLASGYRKGELIRHYVALPTIIGVVAAVVGNLVGYRFIINAITSSYYHSYSLPPYHTYFSADVFVLTTVVPLVMLIVITLVGIARKLGATPLAFLRHEVQRRSRRSSLALPERWSFARRFRTRVFLRNASHYVVLLVGIAFAEILLLMGMCILPLVQHYASQMEGTVPAKHVYLLKAPLEVTDAQDAEKICVSSLTLPRRLSSGSEEISVYGIQVSSDYYDFDVAGGKIVVGSGLATKCGLAVGEQVVLTNKYTGDTYTIAPDVVAGEGTDMNIYMSRATYCEIFDEPADYFNGYVSDAALDLDDRYVASEMTPEDMSAIAVQMEDSMTSIVTMVFWLAIPISIVLIYLLTKTVIDRSARYISYMKVFGYHDREVSALYVRSITWTVLGSIVVSLPLTLESMRLIMAYMLDSYSGYMELWVSTTTLVEVAAALAATYAVVALVHLWRIRRIGLAEAMKAQE